MSPIRRDHTALLLLPVLALALYTHREVLGFELMGWDSYPLIASSRIDSDADLARLCCEELMGGRYPHGTFYRPFTSALFALEGELWGLDPRGYQALDLTSLLLASSALFALACRWLDSPRSGVLAAALFALHPLQLEALPVPARRSELLFSAFCLFALAAWPRPAARRPRAARAGVALLLLLAAATKDSGLIGLPLLGAALALRRQDRAEALRSARAFLGPAIALLLYFFWRVHVLGGLGGHSGASLIAGSASGLLHLPFYLHQLALPQPWFERPAADALLWGGLAATGACLLAAFWNSPVLTSRDGFRSMPTLACLLVLLALLHGFAGKQEAWYALPFLPYYALALAGLAEAACRAPALQRRLGLAGVAILSAGALRHSPLVSDYPQWRELSAAQTEFLTDLGTALRSTAPGRVISAPSIPIASSRPLEVRGVRGASGLSDYSVQAWAELHYPQLEVEARFRKQGLFPLAPRPGVIGIDLGVAPPTAQGAP